MAPTRTYHIKILDTKNPIFFGSDNSFKLVKYQINVK